MVGSIEPCLPSPARQAPNGPNGLHGTQTRWLSPYAAPWAGSCGSAPRRPALQHYLAPMAQRRCRSTVKPFARDGPPTSSIRCRRCHDAHVLPKKPFVSSSSAPQNVSVRRCLLANRLNMFIVNPVAIGLLASIVAPHFSCLVAPSSQFRNILESQFRNIPNKR